MREEGNRKVWHIVVAAGTGSRLGGEPKQYRLLGGRPAVVHALQSLLAAVPGSEAVVVINAAHDRRWADAAARHGLEHVAAVHGGATRAGSVANALAVLEGRVKSGDIIAVHDAARPLVDAATVRRVVQAAAAGGCQGAVPVVAVADSLRRLLPGGGSEPVDRAPFRAVQTPQAFPAEALLGAYRSVALGPQHTDDASVVESAGGTIATVEGSATGFKITRETDLLLARLVLDRESRRRRRIVLVGMPASGKTTLGEALAKALGRPFVDLDAAIAGRSGRPVADILRRDGEETFRRIEADTLAAILADDSPAVIATGGGTPCFHNNIDRINECALSVWLQASPAVLERRMGLQRGQRPLAQDDGLAAYIARTLDARTPHYARAHMALDADRLESEAEIAATVADALALCGLNADIYTPISTPPRP